ncbi:MAG: tRNA preQ1(34) S-adenosylmethionine ribosyltransferase-isomerase QueA, partial [Synergistaceae bacterium]|nr:tRNA preQ1(34) S-adenosylmethionine ribosyltransferase-isomerase QueA [Synergistaceae bacterium]
MANSAAEIDLNDLESYAPEIPDELIAQNPSDRRDGSRLMRLDVNAGLIEHRKFADLPGILRPGDLLVLNDTRVFRARVEGVKIPGGASVEIFFLAPSPEDGEWRALVRPGRKLPPGTRVALTEEDEVEIGRRLPGGSRNVRAAGKASIAELIERHGQVPLPPYIKHSSAPEERYQTVYSDMTKNQSVAAPTAGLHFTPELLEELGKKGMEREFITLDVGVGTFRPVKTRDIREHEMHAERCALSERCADRINEAKKSGRRVIAVGTTVVRTLESFAGDDGRVASGIRDTGIFIRPGYRFKIPDAIITNFHLPRSTLLMLVAAFAGYETTMAAYKTAVAERY